MRINMEGLVGEGWAGRIGAGEELKELSGAVHEETGAEISGERTAGKGHCKRRVQALMAEENSWDAGRKKGGGAG